MLHRALATRALVVVALGGALGSVALACGEDPAPVTPAPADASVTTAPDAASPSDAAPPRSDVEAFCAGSLGIYEPRYVACCNAADAPKRYAFDEVLLKGLGDECTGALGASLAAGRASLDADAAKTCAANASAALAALTCPEVYRKPTNQDPPDIFNGAAGCQGVMIGHQSSGQPCRADYECVDGLTCIGWTTKGDGVCSTPPGDGGACGYAIPDGGGFVELVKWGFGTHPRCAPGFYCAATATQQGTCKAKSGSGGPCDDDDACPDGLRCQVGICGTAAPAGEGAVCKRTSDCEGTLFCKSADGGHVCAPRGVAGTPCTYELSPECEGACVKPDGGSPICVAYCGSN